MSKERELLSEDNWKPLYMIGVGCDSKIQFRINNPDNIGHMTIDFTSSQAACLIRLLGMYIENDYKVSVDRLEND